MVTPDGSEVVCFFFSDEGNAVRYQFFHLVSCLCFKQSTSVCICKTLFSALTKICKLIDDHLDAEFILWNGSGVQIKHRLFEKYVDEYLNAK